MKEHYATYEQAQRLHELGFDGVDTYYVTQKFHRVGNPDECYCEGQIVGAYIVHYFNDKKPDDFVIPAPRLDQAQTWLREAKGVEVVVEPRFCNYKLIGYDWHVFDDCSGDYALRAPLPFSETYDAALSAGIEAALDLLTGKP